MNDISRRIVLGGLATFTLGSRARARTIEEVRVAADDGEILARRYPADGDGKRPAVLALHGSRGVELDPNAYARHAEALAAAGIDAYLVPYFTAADAQAHDPKTSTPESRGAYNSGRFAGWSRRVSSVVSAVLARPGSTGRIGLLGFSLGGFVAAQTAAEDARVTALAVLYGGMPDTMVARVTHLPPLLELHGDADRTVPPAKGAELVRLARGLGAPAEQATYPGRGHGFDFSDKDPMTADAIARVVRFFRANLAPP
jgi:carboxymethylenebutenolidase